MIQTGLNLRQMYDGSCRFKLDDIVRKVSDQSDQQLNDG